MTLLTRLALVALLATTVGCNAVLDSRDASGCRDAVEDAYDPETVKASYPQLPAGSRLDSSDPEAREFMAFDWAECMTRKKYLCNGQIDGEIATVPELKAFIESDDFDIDSVGPATHCGGESTSIPNPFVGDGST